MIDPQSLIKLLEAEITEYEEAECALRSQCNEIFSIYDEGPEMPCEPIVNVIGKARRILRNSLYEQIASQK